MEDKNKRIIMVLLILTIIFTLMGGTFAYWNWDTSIDQRTDLVFTTNPGFSCGVNGGNDITSQDVNMVPTSCNNSEHAIIRKIDVVTRATDKFPVIYMDLWLDVNELGIPLSESTNFSYAITKSDSSCDDPIKSGNFNGLGTNSRINLLEMVPFSRNASDTYYLYIWLDKAEENPDTAGQSFNLSLGGRCSDGDSSLPSKPVLDDSGMIPVTISSSENGAVVTTVSSDDPNWYNYNEKKWANVVLVKDSGIKTREENMQVGTEIDNSDILGYYVWIPRYSYRMNGVEESISISFNKDVPDGYISHPAFTFGKQELDGIWVGKFESSQGTSSTTGDTTSPTVLPSVTPWTNQNVSTQFQTSLKFSGGTLSNGFVSFTGSNTYGLTKNTDSHMMKNSEWGAVAYLSHSQYGTCTDGECTEVGINNYYDSGYKTGCGVVAGTGESTICTNEFGIADTYPQSTNGNITGVFDMSGGTHDYIMGVFANSSGDLWTGYSATLNSGFNGYYGINGTTYEGEYTSGINFPPSKYYDVYKATADLTINAVTVCNGGICYGHALSETSGWYSDNADFVYFSQPWFARGGSRRNGVNSGVFRFNNSDGNFNSHISWRSVLVDSPSVPYYSDDELNGADPVVPDGLIPVTISSSSNGPVVKTADPYSEWYNYKDKEWANAVLVSSTNRAKYLGKYYSGEPTVIDNSDILGYYVWIPRYSYKMNGTEKAISISFNETPNGYISHPAFKFGGDIDGIWVGKFEATGDVDTPTILPSVAPLTNQNVSTQFQTALKFSGGILSNGSVSFDGNSNYGLVDDTDSHMMKNSEWGAVAYLSHSIYGTCTGSTCTEVGINNYYNSGHKTGCGAVARTAKSKTCTNEFGTVDVYPQSTTGNITGIFDMSGGVNEYVMGVFANSSGTLWGGGLLLNNPRGSGFNGLYGDTAIEYTSGIPFPTGTKYYDIYKATSGTTISAETACNGGVCYGHALSETSGWYSDDATFVKTSHPWFRRGGAIDMVVYEGILYSSGGIGYSDSYYSWRSVLVGKSNLFHANNLSTDTLTLSYDSSTSYLTLDGVQGGGTIGLNNLFNQSYVAGEEYMLRLTHVSGNITSSGTYAFGIDIVKNTGLGWVTGRNNKSIQFPSSGVNTEVLTISEASGTEGIGWNNYIWVANDAQLIFDNYVVKVEIIKL